MWAALRKDGQIEGESSLTSNDLAKKSLSQLYPVAWVLDTSKCSEVDNQGHSDDEVVFGMIYALLITQQRINIRNKVISR